ncbi:hypothetical protein IAQ61_004960 [Plenodomus lingam]|uniref:Predicted protein n=1 Tax=Leptosphaeria maculans (strain JN3 / isolate v23.1.3 / race Av1-4-5-6-7-8) TaxID=985895 RepID=E4ZT89_LEPMJ|nr:predicted protein [Plenodomus lingam JN3]KAH9872560.1 hypothetical protein IAQ61_004960 [Plenodomus lingam]CBX90031.1 predicted protein [Plenodomus lingam JN3]
MSVSDEVRAAQRIEPVAIHPSRETSNRDLFWHEYSLNWEGVEHRLVTPSVAFELQAIQQPAPRRTMSLGPDSRRRWPRHMADPRAETGARQRKHATRCTGKQWLQRMQSSMVRGCHIMLQTPGKMANTTVSLAKRTRKYITTTPSRWKNRISRIRMPSARIIAKAAVTVATAALVGSMYMKFNYDFALAKAAQPSIVTRYSLKYPSSWMHAECPARILGLPEPLDSKIVNRHAYTAAFRKFAIRFHPDKYLVNGFTLPFAHLVYMRGFDAKAALDLYYDDTNCLDGVNKLDQFNTSADGLPSYASSCRCTYLHAVVETSFRAIFPFFLQPAPPQTPNQLAKSCPPCTFSIAAVRWKAFNEENRPPPIRRLRLAVPLSRVFDHPYIWRFMKIDRSRVNCLPEFKWSQEEKQKWEDKGWATPEDWIEHPDDRICRIAKRMSQPNENSTEEEMDHWEARQKANEAYSKLFTENKPTMSA